MKLEKIEKEGTGKYVMPFIFQGSSSFLSKVSILFFQAMSAERSEREQADPFFDIGSMASSLTFSSFSFCFYFVYFIESQHILTKERKERKKTRKIKEENKKSPVAAL